MGRILQMFDQDCGWETRENGKFKARMRNLDDKCPEWERKLEERKDAPLCGLIG